MTKNEERQFADKDAEVRRMSEQITELNARLTCGRTNDVLLEEATKKLQSLQNHVRSQRDDRECLQQQIAALELQLAKTKKKLAAAEDERDELRRLYEETEEVEPGPSLREMAAMGLRRVVDWMEGR